MSNLNNIVCKGEKVLFFPGIKTHGLNKSIYQVESVESDIIHLTNNEGSCFAASEKEIRVLAEALI